MFCLGALIVKFKLLKKMGFVQGTTTVRCTGGCILMTSHLID